MSQLLQMHHEEAQQVQKQSAEAFEKLSVQLGKVTGSLLTQGALNSVSEFSGKEKFSDWIQQVEKCRLIHGLTEHDACQLVWAKSKDTVSRLVGRALKEKPETTFNELSALLEREYGDIVDKQQAFIKLTSVRQYRDEDMSSYVERLLQLADRAYGSGWRDDPRDYIEDQLVSIFMEGLRSQELKMRIYRKQVREIDEAIKIAKAEDFSKKRFPGVFTPRQRNDGVAQGRRHEEAMEVEHNRRGGCFNCGGPHRRQDCREREFRQKRVQAVQSQNRGQDDERLRQEDWRQRRCFNCHQVGHYAARCRQKRLN